MAMTMKVMTVMMKVVTMMMMKVAILTVSLCQQGFTSKYHEGCLQHCCNGAPMVIFKHHHRHHCQDLVVLA